MRGQKSKEVLEQLRTMTPAEITTARGCKPQSVYNILSRLARRGLVVHEAHGKWRVVESTGTGVAAQDEV